jgi:hypothetical protein
VHRIFFAVVLDNSYTIYGYYDSGCDRSCISRAALKALIQRKGCPVTERACGVRLVGWFGSKSQATSEITVRMKIGRQEETVDLLVVDDLDYDLVIGNDILRDKFRAGIDAGTKQHIRLNSGSKVPYCTSVDPVRPDENRRVPIQIAEHQVVTTRSISHVRVPPAVRAQRS